jgi:hypothetical protein
MSNKLSDETRLRYSLRLLVDQVDFFRDHWKNNITNLPCPDPYYVRSELIQECNETLNAVYEGLGTDKILGYEDFDVDGGFK